MSATTSDNNGNSNGNGLHFARHLNWSNIPVEQPAAGIERQMFVGDRNSRKPLRNEWAKHAINVNAIAPGYMRTSNTAALQADETRNPQILERIPAARWGKPEDLAGAAVFLASRASDYVNGHVLVVDGGWMGR